MSEKAQLVLPAGRELEARLDALASHAVENDWPNTHTTVLAAKAEINRLNLQLREAKAALDEARSGLVAYTGGSDGACSETIMRIDAVLA